MMDVVVIALLLIGCAFVVVGTVGLLRFPDLPTRLHAVAKADNLGLGFIVAALVLDAVGRGGEAVTVAGVAAKLLLIWVLALLGTAGNSHLLAGSARRRETGRAGRSEDPT